MDFAPTADVLARLHLPVSSRPSVRKLFANNFGGMEGGRARAGGREPNTTEQPPARL